MEKPGRPSMPVALMAPNAPKARAMSSVVRQMPTALSWSITRTAQIAPPTSIKQKGTFAVPRTPRPL